MIILPAPSQLDYCEWPVSLYLNHSFFVTALSSHYSYVLWVTGGGLGITGGWQWLPAIVNPHILQYPLLVSPILPNNIFKGFFIKLSSVTQSE